MWRYGSEEEAVENPYRSLAVQGLQVVFQRPVGYVPAKDESTASQVGYRHRTDSEREKVAIQLPIRPRSGTDADDRLVHAAANPYGEGRESVGVPGGRRQGGRSLHRGKTRKSNKHEDDTPHLGGSGESAGIGVAKRGGKVVAMQEDRVTADDIDVLFAMHVDERQSVLMTDTPPLYKGGSGSSCPRRRTITSSMRTGCPRKHNRRLLAVTQTVALCKPSPLHALLDAVLRC